MNTSKIGNIGECKALLEFTKLGIPCYIPYGDGNVSDLIADFNGKLNRIQVKTTEAKRPNGALTWKIAHQAETRGFYKSYTQNEVDYFVLYCIENDGLYIVPYSNDLPKEEIRLRLSEDIKVFSEKIKKAEDYLFCNVLNNILNKK